MFLSGSLAPLLFVGLGRCGASVFESKTPARWIPRAAAQREETATSRERLAAAAGLVGELAQPAGRRICPAEELGARWAAGPSTIRPDGVHAVRVTAVTRADGPRIHRWLSGSQKTASPGS